MAIGTQPPINRRGRRYGRLAALLTAFMLIGAPTATPAFAISAAPCHVRNLTHPGRHQSLASAVRAARDGDRLVVRGTCLGETTIRDRVTILGRQSSNQRPPTLRGTGKRPVLRVRGGASVRVVGLTVEGPERKLGYGGGGVYNEGTATLEDVIVRGFRTSRQGGGVYNAGGTLRLTGTTSVTGNGASEGGGVLNNMGSLTLEGTSAITANAAGWGGGVANYSGTVTLSGSSSVSANSAGWGGGIANYTAGIVVLNDHATVSGNSASEGAGGIHNREGAVTLNGPSSISGNSSEGDGGGLINVGGNVSLNDTSTLAGNRAGGDGGGIDSSLGSASVTLNDNSSLAGNTAGGAGGGIRNGGYLSLQGAASITGNIAGSQGGGVEDDGGASRGVSCAPNPTANVLHNTPDDCGPGVTPTPSASPKPESEATPIGTPPPIVGPADTASPEATVDEPKAGAEATGNAPGSIPDLESASDTGSLVAAGTTLILRPDGDAPSSGLSTSVGSTAWDLVDEEVLDTSDYVQATDGGYAFVTFPDTGLPSDQAVEQVAIRADVANPAPAKEAALAVRRGSDSEVDSVLTLPQNVSADQSVTLTTRPWDGQPWTAADVDALQAGIVGPASFSKVKLRQIWLEVSFATRTPAGYDTDDVTADSTPTLSGAVDEGARRVDLYDGEDLVGSDSTVGSGGWSITSKRLDDGVHSLWARVTGADGTRDTGVLVVTIETEGLAALTPDSDTGVLIPAARTLTLRPDADAAISGSVTLSAGSTAWDLVDEAILRTSDTIGVQDGFATVSFPTSGLVSTDLIGSITINASVRNPAPAVAGTLFVRDPATSTDHVVDTISQNPTPSRSVTLTSRPWDSQPWTVADLDALEIGAACDCAAFPQLHIDQLWIEVAYTTHLKGASGRDGITTDHTPTLAGTNSTTADRVDVLEDDVVIASDRSVSDGTWEVTLPAQSPGQHSFEIEVYDDDDVLTGTAPDVHVTVQMPFPSTSTTAP
jgi:hypothetical protein